MPEYFTIISMAYTIYFHDDLDGVTSSALLLRFFRERGIVVNNFVPVNYNPTFSSDWPKYNFSKPFVLVDFSFHPEAEWWFDHHNSPFVKEEWKKEFKNDNQHFLDSASPSCCGLIYKTLTGQLNVSLPKYFQELAEEVNIIDGGLYESIDDALEAGTPIRKIARTIKYSVRNRLDHEIFLIQKLSEQSADEIIELDQVKERIQEADKKFNEVVDSYRKSLVERGKVAYVDLSSSGVEKNSFISFKICPNTLYGVNIDSFHNGASSGYHISIGTNIEKKPEAKANLGDLAKKFNGGGHPAVAGIDVATHKEALDIAEYFVDYLNKNG